MSLLMNKNISRAAFRARSVVLHGKRCLQPIFKLQETASTSYHSAFQRRGFANSQRVHSGSGLSINQTRLWDTIHHTAQWGATPEGGVRRLALTDLDKSVREWFVTEAKQYGCSVKIDQMGNIFAIRRGRNNDIPPIGIGSHLDTQPAGGRYDGILGVQAGLEILKVLEETGTETHAPLAVINWTNEEGARFTTGMLSSAVWAGNSTLQEAYDHVDSEGLTLKSELERIGFLGDVEASFDKNPLSAHFECHIEQGPFLEDEGKSIGVVTGVQGMTWLMVDVVGRSQHCGTTPIDRRSDALLAASQMVSRVNEIAWENGGVTTVGVFRSSPQSPGTIPEETTFSVDIEHLSNETMDQMAVSVREGIEVIARKHGCKTKIEQTWRSAAVAFDEECIGAVRDAAILHAGKDGFRELPAGAGHDSVNTSYKCPTSMVFIPSKDGISHHPSEYSSPEHW
jgi:N-carbamoyl-L-amino-acid hydrolase